MSNLSIGEESSQQEEAATGLPKGTAAPMNYAEEFDLRGLIERIQERIEHLETNAKQVSLKAKLGETAVSDIISGKNKNPSAKVVQAIATALDCDVSYLLGETPEPRIAAPTAVEPIECTVKRAHVFRDRIELRPESTDSRHQTIIVSRDLNNEHTSEVMAIGLVYGLFHGLE